MSDGGRLIVSTARHAVRIERWLNIDARGQNRTSVCVHLEVWCVQEHEAASAAPRTIMLWVIVSAAMLRCSFLSTAAIRQLMVLTAK